MRVGEQEFGAIHSTEESGESVPHGDPLEGRDQRVKEPLEGKMRGSSCPQNILTKQRRIAEISREAPNLIWTTLAHRMDEEWMEEAYHQTRKGGATGVDGVTSREYAGDHGERLKENLRDLLKRARDGRYWAPPVRRAYIPKGDGKELRPLGIPTIEDKVLQRGVVMLMEPVYEQDFLECSYGFRPRRGAHDAIKRLDQGIMQTSGGWLIEIDIRKYFDTVDHGKLHEIVRERIRDGEILRLIGKWLKAGVLEEGKRTSSESGTPQGGVISPMLANIYLHKVLDLWFEQEVKPRLQGQAFLVRYADDAVLSFAGERDARRVMEVLPKRFEKYGLILHPDKTRLLEFKPPFSGKKRETFDFLGWTHYWGKTRKGQWMMKHKTMRKRLSRALKRMNQWMRLVRHQEIEKQQEALKDKLKGHYNYYGVSGNSKALKSFLYQTERLWRKWLGRRSQRAKRNWEWFAQLLQTYPLPQPRIKVRLYAM